MERMYVLFLSAILLALSLHSKDMQVSSQSGTVQTALFDYISRLQQSKDHQQQYQQQQQQPGATATNTTPPPSPPVASGPAGGSDPFSSSVGPGDPTASSGNTNNLYDVYSSMMNPPAPSQTPAGPLEPQPQPQQQQQPLMQPQPPPPPPSQTQPPASGSGTLSVKSFADLFASAVRPAMSGSGPVLYQAQGQRHAPAQVPSARAPPAGQSSNSMGFYQQLMQVVNPSQQQQQMTPAAFPRSPLQTSKFVKSPPAMNVPSFVPKEWNVPRPMPQPRPAPWGSIPSRASTGWGQRPAPQAHPAWSHPQQHHHQQQHRLHQQHQQRHAQHAHYQGQYPDPSQPAPHPLSQLMMMPKFRTMVTQQATQFGELSYYQQHGCLDPTPKVAGPGGIRPTQTLWLGCSSPVSQMVCRRAGARATVGAGANSGLISMMMKMMNPEMTKMMEKCLTPKVLTSIMFRGLSGGAAGGAAGGMNPALMMMMSGGGGGGGGMASALPLMMMMNRRNNLAGGAAGGTPADPSSATSAGPLSQTSAPNSVPSSGKQGFKDPNSANLLISQAAKIPLGAAQPQHQSGNMFSNLFGGMFGAQQSPASRSGLPAGAAGPSAATGQGTGAGPGEQPVDCSAMMPMIMSAAMTAGEGLGSPEAMEAVTNMRKKYLPYTCQEMRLRYTGLPFNMCCPGRVDPPSMMDLFKAKSTVAA